MTAERQIPNRLFIVAGQAIEEALRRETALALSEYNHYSHPIASWEDNRVVIIPGRKVSLIGTDLWWPVYRNPGEVTPPVPEPQQLFLDFVLQFATKIYIEHEELYIELPYTARVVSAFLSNPENAEMLRDISRAITGSVRVSHLIVRGPQPYTTLLRYEIEHVVEKLLSIIRALHAKGNHALAQRFEKFLDERVPREIATSLQRPVLPHHIQDDSTSSHNLKE